MKPAQPPLTLVAPPEAPAPAERSDDELLQLAAAGSTACFAELARRHAASVLGFCTRLVGGAGAGEELAQDVWLEVWKRRRSYRPGGSFPAFLFSVARSRCLNHLRRRSRWSRVEPELLVARQSAPEPSDEASLQRLLREERQRHLVEALAALPVRQREAVLLRFSHDLDYETIAGIVGASPSTARSRVFHGLRALRARLSPERSR